MFSRLKRQSKTIKEAILNSINIRKIIDCHVRKQLRIQSVETAARNSSDSGINEDKSRNDEIIVSLTTYSKRIFQVHLVVESLFEQNVKADRIILWLDKDEFTSIDDLPRNLTKLQSRGLEIAFCDNLRSYKKLIPALKRYPNALIITTDDDILYPEDFVERLYCAYVHNPNKIYFYRGHLMKVRNGKILPYKDWDLETELRTPSLFNFPTGCGGVLYSSSLIDDEVFNEDAFMKLAPTADDVWFKAMTLRKRIECEQIQLECPFRNKFIFLDAMDDMALANSNLIQDKNDSQILAVFERYNLVEHLK